MLPNLLFLEHRPHPSSSSYARHPVLEAGPWSENWAVYTTPERGQAWLASLSQKVLNPRRQG